MGDTGINIDERFYYAYYLTNVGADDIVVKYTDVDDCYCKVHLCNPTATIYGDMSLFVVLDVAGIYFFAPSFSEYDFYLMNLNSGETVISVVEPFIWPASSGITSDASFIAAMSAPDEDTSSGKMDIWPFGWGN